MDWIWDAGTDICTLQLREVGKIAIGMVRLQLLLSVLLTRTYFTRPRPSPRLFSQGQGQGHENFSRPTSRPTETVTIWRAKICIAVTETEYAYLIQETHQEMRQRTWTFFTTTSHMAHVLQNTIDSCINSATDRRDYVLECRFTKFIEITQCNGYHAVQGHSRSWILVPIESSYTTSC